MLLLPADIYVRTYFENRVKCYSPAIRQIILEDVHALLEGRPGEFIEGFDDLRNEFLEVCDLYRMHLSCPWPRR